MLIIGAKGLAQELLDILHDNGTVENLVFYDDISQDSENLLFNQFPILRKEEEAIEYLKKTDKKFTLGVGFPHPRKELTRRFSLFNGELTSVIAKSAIIGNYNTIIESGVHISLNVCISSSVHIKRGSFINAGSIIGHDTVLGEFTVVCPSTNIGGHCKIGNLTFIGTGSIIYPKVTIGKNVSITAGSIIRKNIPDNAIVHGIEGKVIKIKKS